MDESLKKIQQELKEHAQQNGQSAQQHRHPGKKSSFLSSLEESLADGGTPNEAVRRLNAIDSRAGGMPQSGGKQHEDQLPQGGMVKESYERDVPEMNLQQRLQQRMQQQQHTSQQQAGYNMQQLKEQIKMEVREELQDEFMQLVEQAITRTLINDLVRSQVVDVIKSLRNKKG